MEAPDEQMVWLMQAPSFRLQACINTEKDITITTFADVIPALAGVHVMSKLYHTMEVQIHVFCFSPALPAFNGLA